MKKSIIEIQKNKIILRKKIRQRRQNLSEAERKRYAKQFASHVIRMSWYKCAKKIAFYLANDGEMDLKPLMDHALMVGKQCFLPVIHEPFANRLLFAPYQKNRRMSANRFGILEPRYLHRKVQNPKSFDIALVPLVAFDAAGHRLGMGGGFYDRTFAYLRDRTSWLRPKLMGVAYDFQQIDQLDQADWDVPMCGVITESGYTVF